MSRTSLALPDRVKQQCLAHRDRTLATLESIHSPQDAAKVLRATDGMCQLLRDYEADTEAFNALQQSRLWMQAKLGELMPSGQGKRGESHFDPQGIEVGTRTKTRLRKVAAAKDKIDQYFQAATDAQEPVEMSTAGFLRYEKTGSVGNDKSHVENNSGNNEWYTPPIYIDAARDALGEIDLDPASSEAAQKNVGAKRFFTADDDGLSQDWSGTVWMNPPYSSDLVGKFCDKLVDSVVNGTVTAAVVLVNNATETKWFDSLSRVASAACFPIGRIRYLGEDGEEKKTPLQGQAFVYIGKDVKRFVGVFREFGPCWRVAK